jgi:hypothetical protein
MLPTHQKPFIKKTQKQIQTLKLGLPFLGDILETRVSHRAAAVDVYDVHEYRRRYVSSNFQPLDRGPLLANNKTTPNNRACGGKREKRKISPSHLEGWFAAIEI